MTAAEQEFLNNPLGKDTTLEDVLDGFEFLDDWEAVSYTHLTLPTICSV